MIGSVKRFRARCGTCGKRCEIPRRRAGPGCIKKAALRRRRDRRPSSGRRYGGDARPIAQIDAGGFLHRVTPPEKDPRSRRTATAPRWRDIFSRAAPVHLDWQYPRQLGGNYRMANVSRHHRAGSGIGRHRLWRFGAPAGRSRCSAAAPALEETSGLVNGGKHGLPDRVNQSGASRRAFAKIRTHRDVACC